MVSARPHRFVGPHGEEVGHERREAGREAGLRDEAEFELGEADGVVPALPVPRRDVEQVRLRGTHELSFVCLGARESCKRQVSVERTFLPRTPKAIDGDISEMLFAQNHHKSFR